MSDTEQGRPARTHWKLQQAQRAVDELLEAAQHYEDICRFEAIGSELVYKNMPDQNAARVLRLARQAAKAIRTAALDPDVIAPADPAGQSRGQIV